jgi:hypothetical protein
MKDENDFFDDLIDDETETFSSEFADAEEFEDDGEEDEDDDEPLSLRTAVLTKSGMIALLTLKAGASGGQIVRVDPREQLPTAQRYDDAESALNWFRRSLATSRRNGWEVVYDGSPMFG